MKITKLLIMAIILFSVNKVQAQNTASQISDEQAHEIVLHGTPAEVQRLVNNGYDINKTYHCNTLLNTAIKSAAKGEHAADYPSYAIEKVKILVNAGANVNQQACPNISMSALNWAVSLPLQMQNTEKEIIKVTNDYIDSGAVQCNLLGIISKPCKEITNEDRKKIEKDVKSAYKVMNKQLVPYYMEIVSYLADNGAKINGNNDDGHKMSPLHIAAMNPEEITLEPLKYLITKGANVNQKDETGNTPLFTAYGFKNKVSVELLIKAGADINIKNNLGAFYKDVTGMRMVDSLNGIKKSEHEY